MVFSELLLLHVVHCLGVEVLRLPTHKAAYRTCHPLHMGNLELKPGNAGYPTIQSCRVFARAVPSL